MPQEELLRENPAVYLRLHSPCSYNTQGNQAPWAERGAGGPADHSSSPQGSPQSPEDRPALTAQTGQTWACGPWAEPARAEARVLASSAAPTRWAPHSPFPRFQGILGPLGGSTVQEVHTAQPLRHLSPLSSRTGTPPSAATEKVPRGSAGSP